MVSDGFFIGWKVPSPNIVPLCIPSSFLKFTTIQKGKCCFFFKSLSKKNFERRNKMEEGLFSFNFFSIYERHLHQQTGFFFLSNWNQSGGIGSKLILSRWLRGEFGVNFIYHLSFASAALTLFFHILHLSWSFYNSSEQKSFAMYILLVCKGVFHRDFHPQIAQKSWTSQNNWF